MNRTSAPLQKRSVRPMQRACSCGGRCEECRRKKRPEVQARRVDGGAATDHVPESIDAALAASGRPLETKSRGYFERRFARDFSQVRIHTGERAGRTAIELGADAYARGQDIVFAPGRYAAGSRRSERLLAHELTHVLQQRSGLAAPGIGAAHDPAEREAERNADALHTDRPLTFSARGHAISRQATLGAAAPMGPVPSPANVCTARQVQQITPPTTIARDWLGKAIGKLSQFIAAPNDDSNGDSRQAKRALGTHFKSDQVRIGVLLRTRLVTIRSDMAGRPGFNTECHDASDRLCALGQAYIPGDNQNLLVVCPGFFDITEIAERARMLIHEYAHALLGLDVSDRAYRHNRLLPHLSTAEAMDNAESYAQFVEELATGRGSAAAPKDEIRKCPDATGPLLRESLGRAERWNRDAQVMAQDARPAMVSGSAVYFTTHLGSNAPATRAAAAQMFTTMKNRLHTPIDVRCDPSGTFECSGRHAYRKAAVSHRGKGFGVGALFGAALGIPIGVSAGVAMGGLLGGLIGGAITLLGGLVGLGIASLLATPDTVHVCPTWAGLGADDRHEALLAAVYETYGNLDTRAAARHAALARALHHRYIGTPPAP